MATQQHTHSSYEAEWEESSRKRLRPNSQEDFNLEDTRSKRAKHTDAALHLETRDHDSDAVKDKSITIASTAKHAPQTIAPFLAKHIPGQYAPLGGSITGQRIIEKTPDPNSKFCYRHRPDMLCRRQADEPTMDKLQKALEALPGDDKQGIVQVWSLFSAAPSKYRNLMLQGILAQCCFPQLSYLSANVRELIRIDFLSALPAEVSFRILCFLDTTSLCKASQVSRRWRELADDDVVWHRMCEQHIDRKCTKCGWGLPLLERKRLRATKRQIQLRATGRGLNDWSPVLTPISDQVDDPLSQSENDASFELSDIEKSSDGRLSPVMFRKTGRGSSDRDCARKTRPWKDVYKDRFKVGTNWKHGRCSIKILKGHSNGVMALQFYDNILATGSYDATIKIWDLDTGKEIQTLTGHTMGIRCLQFDDTKLISGSLDKTLKVWNWRTGECISTYTGHAEGIISLHFDSNILVSGSIDKTARVWNFQDRSVFTLRGHQDWVNSVKIDTASRTIFTASDDCTVKLWDLDSKKCIRVFEGHVGQVQQVLPLPPEFDAEEEEADLTEEQVSDAGSPTGQYGPPMSSSFGYQIVTTVRGNHCVTEPMSWPSDRPEPPRYMLTSALDSTIRLWDVSTGRCIRTYFGHVEGVWAIAADHLRIVSGAEDRMVKVWDPKSGTCGRTFTGHAGPVTCIGLSDSRMCSGGEDGEVRVYNFTD